MRYGGLIGAMAVTAALCATIAGAQARDDAIYPDWKGQWERIGGGAFDASKQPAEGSSRR